MKSYPSKPRLLFLYTELAGYFLACLKKLVENYDVEVTVIHWATNKDAPFKFDFPGKIEFIGKERLPGSELIQKVKEFSPDLIYCSGWMDKDYMKIAGKYKKNIPTVFCLDNPWRGDSRQYIACLLSRFTIKRVFSHCWVPGERQRKYARKLGYDESLILNRYYTADVDYFLKLGLKARKLKESRLPHKLIYAGRYTEFKGVGDLWQAFAEWKSNQENDWELWCIGTGDYPPMQHPQIKHFGFVQAGDMEKFIAETSVFIVPSHFEPWGVVLHEFCAAGFPVICSDAVGASEVFAKQGNNGCLFRSGDIKALRECINSITSASDKQLMKMGDSSIELAKKITPSLWCETLMGLFER